MATELEVIAYLKRTITGTSVPVINHGQVMAVYIVKGGWAIGPAFGPKRAKKQAQTGTPAVFDYLPDELKGLPFMGRV